MSEVSSPATAPLGGNVVQLAWALIERIATRAATRRLQRQQADASVVMGV